MFGRSARKQTCSGIAECSKCRCFGTFYFPGKDCLISRLRISSSCFCCSEPAPQSFPAWCVPLQLSPLSWSVGSVFIRLSPHHHQYCVIWIPHSSYGCSWTWRISGLQPLGAVHLAGRGWGEWGMGNGKFVRKWGQQPLHWEGRWSSSLGPAAGRPSRNVSHRGMRTLTVADLCMVYGGLAWGFPEQDLRRPPPYKPGLL